MKRAADGFTLIELLVALGILALLVIGGYRGLDTLIESERHLAAEQEKWRALSLFFDRLEADLQRALPRPARGAAGPEPALLGDQGQGDRARLRLSRAGDAGVDFARAGQRVEYRRDGERLVLVLWPAFDNAPEVSPQVLTLLEGVESWSLSFLQGQAWVERWPPPGDKAALPRAVEVKLQVRGGQPLQRIIVLP
ncbi:MAG: type II secretion system protein GspJ [Burkholderiales bacterium]|nr:MAG: type II secretion system protein GspJ [Burkholderiales bacterium]CAG1004202.1 Type II secretion system protein J [Myxococcaceae bacterium]